MSDFKLLLIGPLPPPLGGATVLFELLTTELKSRNNCEFYVLNSNINKSNPFAVIGLLYKIYFMSSKVNIISLHASYKGIVVLAPFVFFVSKLLKKKLIFRLFGGNFSELYRSSGWLSKLLYDKTLFKADLVLFETQALVKKFSFHGNVRWYPNHRKFNSQNSKIEDNFSRLKIIYISHIRREKGIFELIEASGKLPNVKIDAYGPFYDGLTPEIFRDSKIQYKGIVEREEVNHTLSEYDILILPSYKEGYPGVVIEAFGAGLAVICTSLDTLRELVTANEDAILVRPGNVNDIIDAVNKLDLDRQLLKKLKINSLKKSENFDSNYWTQKYLSFCREVLNGCD